MFVKEIKTCCITSNNNLVGLRQSIVGRNEDIVGYIDINEDIRIDFDKNDIFVKRIPQNISKTNMKLLKKLIINTPNVVLYSTLFDVYYNYDPSKVHDIQVLRNFKSKVGRFCPIDCIQDEGYRFNFPSLTIKKIISREEAINFVEKYGISRQNTIASRCLNFSKPFFDDGAKSLIDATFEETLKQSNKLSEIFKNIVNFSDINKENIFDCNTSIIEQLYKSIISACSSSHNAVLKIDGPMGSYKNRIIQYLFLLIEKGDNHILPFYLDIAKYEQEISSTSEDKTSTLLSQLTDDFDEITKIIENNFTKTPLIMIDGIRNFSCGSYSPYSIIKEYLEHNQNCKYILCFDSDFTINKKRLSDIHPICSDRFDYSLKIKSIMLHRKYESINFINNCIKFLDVELDKNTTAERIYENLVRLNFISLDAYWFITILNSSLADILDSKSNITKIYKIFCLSNIKSEKALDAAAEMAFEYEFGATDFYENNLYFEPWWLLIKRHRSILDFLIAKHYINKMSHLDFNVLEQNKLDKDLDFFNMVLQKSMTRFVTPMLNGIDDYEHKIMSLAEKYYDKLSLFGKSELTFWMARLNNARRRKLCVDLLNQYKKKELSNYAKIPPSDFEKRKESLFLIRGIYVSLIYENDEQATIEYLNSLLENKTANMVNRGFHLEYYGDKTYIPNQSLLDFEDNISVGENTFAVICLSLDKRISRNKPAPYIALIELMTLCNLIQARIESTEQTDVLNVAMYIPKCIRYLEWIITQRVTRIVPNVCRYFRWMLNEFSRLNQNIDSPDSSFSYSHATIYNQFSEAKSIERAGWVNKKIPRPENIVEHMYNCWLLGMLYLPDESSEPKYDKEKILKMLLIHDLGETVTGDIDRIIKEKNPTEYDFKENEAMEALLFSGTYPSTANLYEYLEKWVEWEAESGINYKIAKEIDELQAVYTFCVYLINYPELFNDEDIKCWLANLQEKIETEEGQRISNILFKNNPRVSNIVEKYT